MQRALEELREKFACSIYLVQPDDTQDYILVNNNDATANAIGVVLIQKDNDGRINIISTASRILMPAKQRYTTCKLELIVIVYAVWKFRVYIYSHKVTLKTLTINPKFF